MTSNNVRPHLTLLSAEQKEQTHAYALRVLAQTGVRVDSPVIRARLRPRVGARGIDGATVRLPAELVNWALHAAPHTVDLFDRRGRPAFTLGDGRLHFGVGVTALYCMDPLTDGLAPFTRRSLGDMTRLGNALPRYDCISTIGVLHDVPTHSSDLYAALDTAANTTKPIVLLVSDPGQFPRVLDLFEALVGELGARPFLLPYFNPVSPLVLNLGTTDMKAATLERGLPLIFSNYSLAGISAPMPPAGTRVMLLAGLTVAQMLREGAAVALGMLPNYFDMKTLLNFYDPQSMLINVACAEMMELHGLPHCGVSGSVAGWGADFIAADTDWMNCLTYGLTHGGLAPFVADTLGAKVFSPNTVVYVHEIIEQAQRVAAGFQLDDATAVLDDIAKVGPGGSFLSAPSTRRAYKSTYYYVSGIFPHWTMEKWQAEGAPEAQAVLRERTRQLIAKTPAPTTATTCWPEAKR